jgi:hypothetical protein
MTIKTELTAMKRDLTAIGKKLDTLLKAVEKSEKATVTKVSRPKAVKATATDQVLNIINRSKKGVDTPTLMIKTGFDRKKVTNIIHRTFKQGKIKKTDRGIYVGVK